MKKNFKIIMSLIVVIVLAVAFTTSAFAGSRYVSLATTEYSDVSSAIGSSYSHGYGYNQNTSKYSVYLKLQQSDGGGWSTFTTSTMGLGSSATTGTYYDPDSLWRVELNPVGWLTKNCSAYAYVYDY